VGRPVTSLAAGLGPSDESRGMPIMRKRGGEIRLSPEADLKESVFRG